MPIDTYFLYRKNIDSKKTISSLMYIQTRKYTIKCLMCNEEITEPLGSYFAEPHITAKPGHLEYRIIVEMPSANAPDNDEPTLVFGDSEKHGVSELK